MSSIQPIPMPELLEPDRTLTDEREEFSDEDHRDRARRLATALSETCEYGKQLWNDLAAVRRYLMESLPSDPRSPGEHPTSAASPTGPDDDEGWDKWITAYAAITSTLAGPHGDSGYGLGEARQAATLRRTAPVMSLPMTESAEDAAEKAQPADTAVVETQRVVVGPGQGRSSRDRLRDAGAGAFVGVVIAALTRPRRRRRTG